MQKKLTRLTNANILKTQLILFYRKAHVSQSDARQVAQQFLLTEYVAPRFGFYPQTYSAVSTWL